MSHSRSHLARRNVMLGSAAVTALFLTSCGGSSGGTGSGGTTGSKPLTVGIVNIDTSSITANSFATADEKAMKEKGWKVLNQDPKGDPSQANTICTQYVTRKVSAVVVNIFEASQMAQCTSQAAAAKIPVFFIGSDLAPGMAGAVSTIVAEPINKAFLEAATAKRDLNILELTYKPGAPCRVREESLDKAIAASGGGVKVEKHELKIPGQVVDAQSATQAWLTSHPASKGQSLAIWACFSDPAIGALSALKQTRRTGVPIYTWDFTKQTVQPLKSGEIAATLWTDPAGMAKQMIELIEGQRGGGQPKQAEAAHEVINAANIDAFMSANPGAAQ